MNYIHELDSAIEKRESAKVYGLMAGALCSALLGLGSVYVRAGNILEASTSYVVAGLMRRARKDAKNWERDQTATIERIVEDSRNHRVLEFHKLT